ncbi:T9SS type A sorting domain-containing protein [Aureispira anguillae]|uniref:T9SS type A sorting domain-containing protein n=1 Tax=Aureispira anguillae TaxID=2864201 RepID=A0A916DQ83_9BACT|nr:T9SS type A sorting domain-containing protein [Aureispira anguillae]BDS11019.1 T9SS type A sorting domain-containing protein [Aureispira anguillae]
MKRRFFSGLLLILSCWLISNKLQAQVPFELTLDRLNSIDAGASIIELNNGNLLIAGRTENAVNNSSGRDGFLAEMDPNTGVIEWSRAYGWANDDHFFTVIQAADNSIVVAGYANHGTGDRDMWLLRVEGTGANRGDVIATATFNNSRNSIITEVIESNENDVNGNPTFLVTGVSDSYSEVYLARLDENANLLWSNTYGATNSYWTYALLEDATNNNTIYISGSRSVGSNHRALLMQIANNGAVLASWEYSINNAFNAIFDDIYLSPQGTIIGTGHVHLGSTNSNNTRPIFVEIDPNEATVDSMVVRSHRYNTTNSFIHRMNNFQPILNNGVLQGYIAHVADNEVGGAKIAHLNTNGAVLRYTRLSATTTGAEVLPLSDGTFSLIGSNNNNQVYIAKTDSNAMTPCADSLGLTTTNIGITSRTVTFTRSTLNQTVNHANPTDITLSWLRGSTCCSDSLGVEINQDTLICAGEAVDLEANVEGNFLGATYLWSTGDTSASILVNPTLTTTYYVTVTDTITACTVVDSAKVTVSNPMVTITGDSLLCAGESVTLTANLQGVTGPFTIIWEEQIGANWITLGQGGMTIVVTPNQDRIYRATLIDSLSCETSDSIALSVGEVLLTIDANAVICEGETTDLTANASYVINPSSVGFSYIWQPTNQTGSTISVAPSNTTTYTVIATSNDSLYACSDTAETTVVVNPNPIVDLTPSETGVLCFGDDITLTANNTIGTIAAIAWTGTGITNPITVNPVTLTPTLGANTYTATVVDTNGCHGTASIDVETENCCPARGNTDYLQIDEGADLALLAAYGIRQTGAKTFLVDDGQHHILPNKVYLGDEVLLHVIGTAGFTTIDFTNSDVVAGRNSLIRIEGRGTIIAHNTIFRPCEEFETWGGVRIQPFGGLIHATFNECTFVNAITAINTDRRSARGNANTSVEITNNLFINCGTGIRIDDELNYNGGITGNTFKIDDKVERINYTNPTTTFRGMLIARQDRGMHYPISQNDFIKGTNFVTTVRFEGINLTGTGGENISKNSFTNNDRAIVLMRSRNVTIENNFFEVTRRSNADEADYQVTLEGTANMGYSALVRNNHFVNSAEVLDPSQVTNPINNRFVGTGAIYLGNEGHFTIEANEIDGFEIGIFSDNSVRNLSTRIIKNTIKSHLFGIYIRGFRFMAGSASGASVTLLVACNDIDMDLDLESSHEIIGIYFDPMYSIIGTTNYAGRVPVNAVFEGNCVKNTTTAIAFDYNNPNLTAFPLLPVFRHNYLYNYTNAGLWVNNMQSMGLGFPTPVGRRSENNTFISNNDAFDIEATNAGVVSRNDHFGANAANLSNATAVGTPAHSAAACGNQDIANPTVDANLHCDDDNDQLIGLVAQRQLQTDDLLLTANYHTELRNLYQEDSKTTLAITNSLMQNLSLENEVDALFQLVNSYSWKGNDRLWIEYYYEVRKGNYTLATQKLNAINGVDQVEEDQLTLAKIYLNLLKNNQGLVLNTTSLTALEEIATRDGVYQEEARNLIHINQGNNPYQYAKIEALARRNTSTGGVWTGQNAQFAIFPNPASNKIAVQIQARNKHFVQASVYSIHGRLLQTQAVRAYQMQFDVSELPQGIYFVTLEDESGERFTEKFVKQ